MGKALTRVLRYERTRRDFETAKTDLMELATPAVAWRRFPVHAVEDTHVALAGGTRLGGGRLPEIVRGATTLVVAVVTIGPAVETRVSRYSGAGHLMRATLLDSFASWAVGHVRDQFAGDVKHDLHAAEAFHVSIPASPGEVADWPLTDQATIFRLLGDETAEIGVRLRPSMLMVPIKSLSLVMGAGPDPLGQEAGTNCAYCPRRATCRYKQLHGSN